MASNNTIVISFSIALFLLLILLLLITYNSKCQMNNMDKLETFVSAPSPGTPYNGNVTSRPPVSIPPSQYMPSPVAPPQSVADIQQESKPTAIGRDSAFFRDSPLEAADPLGVSYPSKVESTKPKSEGTANKLNPENSLSCFPRERLTSDDLLPQDANSKWAKVNPTVEGELEGSFLTAGYHIGINTSVGRNNSLDIRHEPMAPQIPVSPWGISTIVPQQKTNGLYDIGSGCLNE
jgi:hypothetical protein